MAQRSGQLRIIGGEFRSRRLRFPAIRDLRPTPDAVRETVFNWLRDDIKDSRCLDLFAGSGAMGFEALSRGARQVTMVDANRQATRQLAANAELLDIAERCQIETARAAQFLSRWQGAGEPPYDVVFLDPPWRFDLISETIDLLQSCHVLGEHARLYVEQPVTAPPLSIPPTWHIIRESARGLVRCQLVQSCRALSQEPGSI